MSTADHFYINRHCNLTILRGFTPQELLKTITVAVHRIASDSLAQKSIYVLPGTYVEGESEQIYPIPLKSYVNIVGADSDQVTLYSDLTETSNVFDFVSGYKVRKVGFRGFRITEGNANNRIALYLGFQQSQLHVSDTTIETMHVDISGAIFT